MYLRITEEESRLMNILKPYIKGVPAKLVDNAPSEAVEAYKKFMEITKDKFDD